MPPLIKTLLVTMILVNAVFFGWNYYAPDKKDLNTGRPIVKQLVLLNDAEDTAGVIQVTGQATDPPETGDSVETNSRILTEQVPQVGALIDKESATDPSKLICLGYDGLRQLDLATDVAMILARQGFQVYIDFERQTVKNGYWVILPPFLNVFSARKAIKILKGRGLKDIAIIASGELENAISLGIFNKIGTAKRRQKELQGIGYHPLLQERRVDRDLYRIRVMTPGATALRDAIPAQYREQDPRQLEKPVQCDFPA
ncbi:MAG: hypothetical protein BMS9Abin26_1019 [Gammaproteobacteria bacterium]|nr:MAG: hypothetical protein BMS9Abin26_1019 [Gammaproteobacteria bacterium]